MSELKTCFKRVDCFAGQPNTTGIKYRIDPGKVAAGVPQQQTIHGEDGFKNEDIALTQSALLENIHKVQQRQNLPLSIQRSTSSLRSFFESVKT